MAKGSANESVMGNLHAQVARVFERVLTRYEADLDAADNPSPEQVGEDVMAEIIGVSMPSPIMLSAITKFLKDNDISFDSEEIEQLSATQERLEARKSRRGKLASLTTLSVVADVG